MEGGGADIFSSVSYLALSSAFSSAALSIRGESETGFEGGTGGERARRWGGSGGGGAGCHGGGGPPSAAAGGGSESLTPMCGVPVAV